MIKIYDCINLQKHLKEFELRKEAYAILTAGVLSNTINIPFAFYKKYIANSNRFPLISQLKDRHFNYTYRPDSFYNYHKRK